MRSLEPKVEHTYAWLGNFTLLARMIPDTNIQQGEVGSLMSNRVERGDSRKCGLEGQGDQATSSLACISSKYILLSALRTRMVT